MTSRSRIPLRFVAKQAYRALTEDARTTGALVKLQLAKETFNLRHPRGARHGRGDGIGFIGVRITDMCNLRCHSCGQWGDNGYLLGRDLKELKRREVPVARYKELVDEVAECGWRPIWYLWGGEPMLYPGLIELLHHLHDRGMPISLVTNGTRLVEVADDILETVQILLLSLDGPNAEIHNTQRPGVGKSVDNFQDVFAALELISAEKRRRGRAFPYLLPLSCITRYNVDHLVDLYQLGSRYADAHLFYLTWWIDPLSAEAHVADFERRFGFKPTTHYGWVGTWKDFDHGVIFDRFTEMDALARRAGRPPPVMMPDLRRRDQVVTYYADHAETFGYEQCVSIFMSVEINSNGDVSLCRDYNDYVLGNIRTDSLRELWEGEKARRFRSSLATEGSMPVCRRCCGLMGY
jgi:radical SAM protein with 4Fe4S-binding SPASM domain